MRKGLLKYLTIDILRLTDSANIFQLCEIDLSGILPPSSLSPFEDELKNREKQRKRVARKVCMCYCFEFLTAFHIPIVIVDAGKGGIYRLVWDSLYAYIVNGSKYDLLLKRKMG